MGGTPREWAEGHVSGGNWSGKGGRQIVCGEIRLESEVKDEVANLGPLAVSFFPFLDLDGDGGLMLMLCGFGGGAR